MKKALTRRVIILITVFLTGTFSVNAQGWGWKKATSVEDVHNFINGTGAYKKAIAEVKISAISKGDNIEFYVFYKGYTDTPGKWGWKKATTTEDAHNFINGAAPYTSPVKKVEICSVNKGTYLEFYIFYQK